MAFGQRLRERLYGRFHGKEQAKGLAEIYGPEIITQLKDQQLSLTEIASSQGTSINTVRQAFQALIASGRISQAEYDAYMARNNSLSQVKRHDLKIRAPKEKQARQPRQALTSGTPTLDTTPPNRQPKERGTTAKSEDPNLTWLRVNLYESRWRNNRSGLPDLDRLAIQMKVSKAKVQYLKQKIDEELRQKTGQ